MPVRSENALTVTLPSDREIVMTRVFNAPRRLVFEAYTKPEHVRHWWGCDGSTLAVCEIDLRVGGAWRYHLRMEQGEFRFHGVYREISPPERLVFTECYDEPSIGSPEWLTTVTFTEEAGRTTMVSHLLHKSKENRDGHLQSGMEGGAAQTLNRLEELLTTLV